VKPTTAFIGVRISWLMVARKTPLATLAGSADSFAWTTSACAASSSAWRRGDEDRPVAVDGQERQRPEDVEVGLDPAAREVDQKRRGHHLSDESVTTGPSNVTETTAAERRSQAATICWRISGTSGCSPGR
jgi:hypothetical protein